DRLPVNALKMIIASPPSPTHFPYTTLFRSPCPTSTLRRLQGGESGKTAAKLKRRQAPRQLPAKTGPRSRPLTSPAQKLNQAPFTDRKSTPLNSSHDQISYAVFCLKKKKEQ